MSISLHRYVSTACTHEIHEGCRVTCKFCNQICLCHCHWERTATPHTLALHDLEMSRRSRRQARPASARNDGTPAEGDDRT